MCFYNYILYFSYIVTLYDDFFYNYILYFSYIVTLLL